MGRLDGLRAAAVLKVYNLLWCFVAIGPLGNIPDALV